MNMEWTKTSTIYCTLVGSRAYGLNTESSDVDMKGIVVPPKEVRCNIFQGFEQYENPEWLHEQFKVLINPVNPKVESSLYSLQKIFKLCADCNPNCIELLYTDPKFHLIMDPLGEKLIENRGLFLSSAAKFRFVGYAFAQMAKIERHRKWITNKIETPPERKDYGLPEVKPTVVEALTRKIRKTVESWNFHEYPLTDEQRNSLKEDCWDLQLWLCDKRITWDNWPEVYWEAALKKVATEVNLKDEVVALMVKEQEYDTAYKNYKAYLRWKAERNPERKVLEEKFQYDTKHAMHLLRLLRMGEEIMATGEVKVLRPDAEELKAVRAGAWSYEKIMEEAQIMTKRIDELYKQTKLPRSADRAALNTFYLEMLNIWDSRVRTVK